MHIWFIRSETDYGPFFSTKEKAISYLENQETLDGNCKYTENNPYVNIEEVELDKENICFDG